MADETVRGVLAGVVDCLLWAAAALYWPLLRSSSDGEILGHRLVWAVLFMGVAITCTGRLGALLALLRRPRTVLLLAGAALAISANWTGFVWGVNHGHVVDASLGFFINPLMTVLLGVVVLHEHVRPAQWLAIAIAGASVIVVTVDYGHLPWYALMLSVSGGCYALFKKKASAGPYESLAVETGLVAPVALVFLVHGALTGGSTFAREGVGHALLLIGGGVVTVTPLLFFGYAAARVPLVTLGLVGYLAPVSTFALGLLYFHEPLPPARWLGFLLVWVALAVFTVDTARNVDRRALETPVPEPAPGVA